MTLAHNTVLAPTPAQIRVTVECLDEKGHVKRKISLCNDFPAWAQKQAIERCLDATSAAAGALLTRVLPNMQVGTGADVIELDPLDYSAVSHEQLTAQDKVQRIFSSPLGVEFSQRAAELGIKSLIDGIEAARLDEGPSLLTLVRVAHAAGSRLVISLEDADDSHKSVEVLRL